MKLEELLGVLGRVMCRKENETKAMDSTLMVSITDQFKDEGLHVIGECENCESFETANRFCQEISLHVSVEFGCIDWEKKK